MMNGKECRATRREIDESELNQRLSDQARSHVALCPSCRGFHAERTSLRELVGSLEPVAAPGDFDMRLRARMASERQSRTRQPFIFRLVISTPAIAVAALVVMLAMSLVWLAQRNRSQAPPTALVPIKEAPKVPDQPQLASTGGSNAVQTEVPPAPVDLKPGSRPGRGGNPFREINSKSALAGVKATDYGVSPAEYIRQREQRAGEVSLSAPLKPMVVSMQDDHGATRRISLPPVSFGAQRLVDNRIPVSSTNSRSW
jgi:hypothetical protein